jgi:aldose 1-epimerase
MTLEKKFWGQHKNHDVYLFTVSNGRMQLSFTNFGCSITSILVPDSHGKMINVVLGYDSLKSYVDDRYYMGCVVGRFANRISKGAFMIDDTTHHVTINEADKNNHLHGGAEGFNKKVFDVLAQDIKEDSVSVTFGYRSPDGEEGFPGNLQLSVTYELSVRNELIIKYDSFTDKATHANFTNHSYFDLSGGRELATQQKLIVNASNYLVSNANFIPTGAIESVLGTPHDFTVNRKINTILNGSSITYNTCFVLADKDRPSILHSPVSGISMEVRTGFPGLLLYTGDYLDKPFRKNQGICLETQFFPDAPNIPSFSGSLLLPRERFYRESSYLFRLP